MPVCNDICQRYHRSKKEEEDLKALNQENAARAKLIEGIVKLVDTFAILNLTGIITNFSTLIIIETMSHPENTVIL